MTDGNDSHNRDNTSSGKQENPPFFNFGVSPETFYPFDQAVMLAGMNGVHAAHIKKNYIGKGIVKWGYDYFCFGSDLIKIIIAESGPNE